MGTHPVLRGMSPIVIAVWSKEMYKVRAKIIKGSAGMLYYCLQPTVFLGSPWVLKYWRFVAVERLQQVSKVLLIAEQRLI